MYNNPPMNSPERQMLEAEVLEYNRVLTDDEVLALRDHEVYGNQRGDAFALAFQIVRSGHSEYAAFFRDGGDDYVARGDDPYCAIIALMQYELEKNGCVECGGEAPCTKSECGQAWMAANLATEPRLRVECSCGERRDWNGCSICNSSDDDCTDEAES